MVLEDLTIVEPSMVPDSSMTELFDIWSDNHQILTDYFTSSRVPYFGLRGCDPTAPQNPFPFWATFYDKAHDEFRLFQLYSITSYVASFARRQKKGKEHILVSNFESADGSNISSHRKYLKSVGELFFTPLDFDTPAAQTMIMRLNDDPTQRLSETQVNVHDSRICGAFTPSPLAKYFPSTFETMARTIVLYRLDAQYDLARAFDLLAAHARS